MSDVDYGPALSMKELHEDDIRRAAIDILNYLRNNPDAKDSVTGIAEWWVGGDVRVVEEGLLLLMRDGVVERQGRIYRLVHKDAAGIDAIQKLVEKLRSQA